MQAGRYFVNILNFDRFKSVDRNLFLKCACSLIILVGVVFKLHALVWAPVHNSGIDPILRIKTQVVTEGSLIAEIVIGCGIIAFRSALLWDIALFVMAGGFVAYHVTRHLFSISSSCGCLGALSQVRFGILTGNDIAFGIAALLFTISLLLIFRR